MSETLPYTTVIGLEVHVQLKTRTKLFCRCSTQFGAPPNTQTCPVCLGLPGALPVMNRSAFDLAVKTAVALHCQIPSFTKWDRKNYYYPDLPKGYQISQFDLPMSQHGFLEISDSKGQFEPKRVGITRAHLEEDAGKSMHDEAAGKADTRIDLNRCGTPLLEIVSEPDMRSPLEAKAYLAELKLLLEYLDVSDCNMQEGSLRVDANINLHIETPAGKVATPIVEVKNMNSFRAVERALAFEAQRQYAAWKETGRVKGKDPKQTRGWDDQKSETFAQRHKEESSDYRYFPDPDLAPVVTTEAEVEAVRRTLGVVPSDLRNKLIGEHKLSPYDADVLVNQGSGVVDYFLAVAKACGDGKQAANWITQDVLRVLKEKSLALAAFRVTADKLAELIGRIKAGDMDLTRGKDVFNLMVESGKSPAEAMQELGITKVDSSALVALCQELLAANPKIVADVQAGKQQALGALLGQAKKKNPNVNPNEVRTICLELIGKM